MELINAFPSAARAVGTHNSASFSVDGAVGAAIWVTTTNINGGGLVVKLQQLSPNPGGGWVDVAGVTTATISTNTDTPVKVYPGIAGTANVAVSGVLGGGIYRLVATVTTATVTFLATVETIG